MRGRMLRECLLLLAGVIVGFSSVVFLRWNQCHFTYKRNFQSRTVTNEVHFKNRQLIFVGVITAEQFLETRAKAVFDTWGRNVAGKLTFFSSSLSEIHKKFKLPVVSLPDVDDSYPPLRKSLMMVKYMYHHHIDEYEWFMRADDDVYVRNDKLAGLLRSLNSSNDIYLGHAGTGAKKERGKLQLLPGDNYCMGGPGVVLSQSVLRKLAPHIDHCLQIAPKSYMHEDVELGRCIRRYVGVSCTWSYEMYTLFFHDYSAKGTIFHGDLNTNTINDAITFHPIKEPAYMFRLHSHFMCERIQDLQHEAVKLQRVLRTMDRLLQANRTRLSLQEKKNLQDERDFHHQLPQNNTELWDMFTSKSFYPGTKFKSSLIEIMGALNIEVNDSLKETKTFIMKEVRKNRRHFGKLMVQEVDYGYRRVHPLYGIQYVVQVSVKTAKKQRRSITGETKPIYKIYDRRFYTQQPFGNLIYSTKPLDEMPPYVHFIVPLKGHLETFRRFMKNFESVCLTKHQRVKLVVAFSSSVSSSREHKVLIREYQDKYPKTDLIWLDVSGNSSHAKPFSLVADTFGQAALLFLCDVEFVFTSEFIDRCRMNTAPGKRVYFPILFGQFDPKVTYNNKTKPDFHLTINKDAGIWRPYPYEPACIYHQDLDAVGGFDTSIEGWGLGDEDLLERTVRNTEIEVFRAADPGLIHAYHRLKCDPNLPTRQQALCQDSDASRLASQKSLIKAMRFIQNTRLTSSSLPATPSRK